MRDTPARESGKMRRWSTDSRVSQISADADQFSLPRYDPFSRPAGKERSRLRSAENAIHVIPLLLLLCIFILWFFSNPATDVNRNTERSL